MLVVARDPQAIKSLVTQGLLLAVIIAIAVPFIYYIKWGFVRALDLHLLIQYLPALLRGAVTTLIITFIATFGGFLLGLLLTLLIKSPVRVLRVCAVGYVEIWRNTPLIVQIFWVHFGLPVLTGISTPAIVSGLIALTGQTSAYLADIIRGGLDGIPVGQWEAGHALGLSSRSILFGVIGPQALRLMLPPFSNLLLSFLNGSALLGLIQVGELFTVTTNLANYTLKPIEFMTATAIGYLVINLMLLLGLRYWKLKIQRPT